VNITFFEHGKGNVKGAINYLLSDQTHDGDDRRKAPIIHGGSPEVLQAACDNSPHEWKYSSGVLRESKTLTEQEKQDLMQSFEEHTFPNIDPDRYSILWVEHEDHDGHTELHFVIARTMLDTNKSFNPAPPNWEQYYNGWRDALNLENGWARPDLPTNTVKTPRFEALTHTEARRAITDCLESSIANGDVQSRDDIFTVLEDLGCEITRKTKTSISVTVPDYDKPIRLKAGIYDERNWKSDGFEGTFERSPEEQERLDREHLKRAIAQRDKARAARGDYFAERHPRPDAAADAGIDRQVEHELGHSSEEHEHISEANQQTDARDEELRNLRDQGSQERARGDEDSTIKRLEADQETESLLQERSSQVASDNVVDHGWNNSDTRSTNLSNNEVNNHGTNTTGITLTATAKRHYERLKEFISSTFRGLTERIDTAKQGYAETHPDYGDAVDRLRDEQTERSEIIRGHQDAIRRTLEYFKGTDWQTLTKKQSLKAVYSKRFSNESDVSLSP